MVYLFLPPVSEVSVGLLFGEKTDYMLKSGVVGGGVINLL